VSGSGSTVTSSGGNVSVTGTGGGSGSGQFNSGVGVFASATITAGGNGAVTVQGTGGATSGGTNIGVAVSGSGSTVTSGGGNVSVTGTGGSSGTGGSDDGVQILSGAMVTAGGTGTVTVLGSGAANDTSTAGNYGVFVSDSGSQVTSNGGNVSVSGTGGGTGSGGSNNGVDIESGATITGGTGATVAVQGSGGGGSGGSNDGVFVSGKNSTVTSGAGNVSVTGTGGGTGSGGGDVGVLVASTGTITAGPGGTVTVLGTGAANDSGAGDDGVQVTGSGSTVTSTGGNLAITGTGGGNGNGGNNNGVAVDSGATIHPGGGATVTITGRGGANDSGGGDDGVLVTGTGSLVTSTNGNVTVTGTGGGTGTGGSNIGTDLTAGGTITAGGSSSTVTVNGVGGGSGTGDDGINIISGTINATASGNLTLNGDATSAGGTGNGVLIQKSSTVGKTGSGNVTINGHGTGEVDIKWDDLTIQKAGGSYVFNGSTLSTGSLLALPGPYVGVINATALGITFQGVLEVDDTVSLTFNAASQAHLGTLTTVYGPTGVITAANGVLVPGGGLLRGTGSVDGPIEAAAGGTVAPGLSSTTGILTGGGSTILDPGSTLSIRLDGTTVGSGYDQLDLTDPTLTGAHLNLIPNFTPPLGTTFTIIHSLTPVVGNFAGLPESTVFTVNGHVFRITYQGGAGDDVVLTALDQAPKITSAGSTTFTVATAGMFTVTTSGTPAVTTIIVSGALPDGVTFTDNHNGTGTLAGTPTVSGSLTLTITASNGIAPSAVQTFTLVVKAASARIVTGTDAGGAPEVKVFDARTGQVVLDFFAFNPLFTGGVRVALGDVNGDGVPDVLAVPGPGGGPEVKVFDGQSGALIRDFFAFNPLLTTGLYVAAGDVNHDGFADIIVAPDAGGGSEVKVYSGKDSTLLLDFFAYNPAFLGGVRVAAGDTNGDGVADIITGAGYGGGPLVNVFSGQTETLLLSFNAYGGSFSGGIYVATGDVNGDGKADILTTPGLGGGPLVNAFSGPTGNLLLSFNAGPIVPPLIPVIGTPSFPGGLRVAAVDINGDGKADIVTGAGPGQLPEVKVLDAVSLAVLDDFFAYDPAFRGGVFVGG
jgi:hypothetical protein